MVEVNKIHLGKKGAEIVLSPMESNILSALRTLKTGRVKNVHSRIRGKNKLALTSVAVGLDRLHKKELVSRVVELGRGGPHYIYSCDKSKEDFEKSVLEAAVDKLLENFGDTAVSYFNERFSKKR